MALRRISKERDMLKGANTFRNVEIENDDEYVWTAIVHPINPPYNSGGFKVRITFPRDYPFKEPDIGFVTPIYHPCICWTSGRVSALCCYAVGGPDWWSPRLNVNDLYQVILCMLDMENPHHLGHSTNAEAAAELRTDKAKFLETAENLTKKHSLAKTVETVDNCS